MKKYDKFDYLNILIIICSFFVVFFLVLNGNNLIYASSLDYANQHYLIPEAFRELFYETKDLFPSFLFNLGMGQNIYYFSYYGLFSPIILFSYLFPFINMGTYLMITSVIIVILSIFLFYKWIANHFENKCIRFIATFIFAMATPLIFHSHRHIMFMNYMPFLIMGLFGIDRYILKNKKFLLMISIFLIILTSYFFSVPSLVVLLAYGIFRYLNKEKEFNFKKFGKFILKFSLLFIIPILMAGFLLLPTFYGILNSRFATSSSVNILEALLPNLSFENILYTSYSLGLTAIFIFSISYLLFVKEKGYRFLSVAFLIIIFLPLSNYLLNGFMYLNGKVLIPFLTLGVFVIAKFLEDFWKKKIPFKKVLVTFFVISVLGCLNYEYFYLYVLDAFLILIILFVSFKKNNHYYLLFLLVISFMASLVVNLNDDLETKKVFSSQYNDTTSDIVEKLYDEEHNLYRIADNSNSFHNVNNVRNIKEYKSTMYSSLANKYYKNFYLNEIRNEIVYRNDAIFSDVNNLFFNIYTGNKYYLSTLEEDIIGYKKIKEENDINIYQNNEVFSLGYSSFKLMSLEEYKSLKYPYNVEALLNYVIVDDSSVISNYKTKIRKVHVKNDKFSFKLDKDKNIVKPIFNLKEGDILLIRFKMNYSESCKIGDTSISINGIANKLTCRGWKYHNKNYSFEYVISSNEVIKNLDVKLTKGKYDISDLEVYVINYEDIKDIKNSHDEFIISKQDTKGDVIKGSIIAREKGYFTLSIPYDKGFKAYVDGKLQEVELVNTSFIGFPLDKGKHDIEIIYEAPYLKEGKCLALLGTILFIGVLAFDWRRKI